MTAKGFQVGSKLPILYLKPLAAPMLGNQLFCSKLPILYLKL